MADNRQETIADIVAEMRRYGARHWMHDEGQSVRDFADRIEAAAKRKALEGRQPLGKTEEKGEAE